MTFALSALVALLSGQAHAGDYALLRTKDVRATSFLRNDWNKFTENYHPNYAFDDNPATAWVEGVEGTGEEQALTAKLSSVRGVQELKLRVRNGYQKSTALFKANAAPKDVNVVLLHRREVVHRERVTLTRTEGWQSVVVRPPKAVPVDTLRLRVKSTHRGSKYADTCISDIQVLVKAKTEYNEAAEAQKLAALQGWARQRQTDAAYFAKKPRTYPWAATQFDYRDDADNLTGDLKKKVMGRIREGLESGDALKDTPWQQLSHKHKLAPLPEGVWQLDSLWPLIDAQDRSFLETTGRRGKHRQAGDGDMPGVEEWYTTNYKIARRNDGSLQTAEFGVKHVVHERGTWTTNERWVASFNEQGQLTSAVSVQESHDELGPSESHQLWTFARNNAGQITRVMRTVRNRYSGWDDKAQQMTPLSEVAWDRTIWTAQP